ncbi:MAG: response regulator [Candidatus Sumerlaeota bacterium]
MDFSLPATSDNATTRPLKDRRLRVLVVEDFESMRRNVVSTLETLNMEILEAVNGLDALRILDNEKVDMVFTDLVMPEMDGFELSEEIRRRTDLRHLPVIVISTHRDAKYVIQALRRGADDYITKPFAAPLAGRVVERALSHV